MIATKCKIDDLEKNLEKITDGEGYSKRIENKIWLKTKKRTSKKMEHSLFCVQLNI